MKNLHSIKTNILPDEVIAEIWKLQSRLRDGNIRYILVNMPEYIPGSSIKAGIPSPIYTSAVPITKKSDYSYHWLWENKLREWIEAGKPAINMDYVVIIK